MEDSFSLNKNAQGFNLDAFWITLDPSTSAFRASAQDDTLLYGHFGGLSDLVAALLQELHVRQLAGEFLHLVGVGHEGGTGVPGTVEELTAGYILPIMYRDCQLEAGEGNVQSGRGK